MDNTPSEPDIAKIASGTANIVDRARTLLVEAVSEAASRCKDDTYLATLANQIANAEGAKMDTWLALDAVILALKATDPAHNKSGGLWYRRWHALAAARLKEPAS